MKRHIKAAAGTIFLALLLSLVFGCITAVAATNAKVSVPVLNVRLGPGTGYGKITSIKVGETYPVIDSRGGWYKLMIGSTPGWVCGDYVQTFNKEAAAPPLVQIPGANGRTSAVESVIVNVNLLNVRSSNSVKAPIIGGIKKGDTYPVIDYSSGWFKIKYNYSQGWISGDYVTVNYAEDQQDEQQPKQPDFTGAYEVQDIEFLSTGTRNCVAIPVDIKINRNDKADAPNPAIQSSMTAEGKLNITLANSSFGGDDKDIEVKGNDLISAVDISTTQQNTTLITVSTKDKVNFEVYTIKANGHEDEEYKYYRFYIVAGFNKGISADGKADTNEPGSKAVKNSQGKTKNDYLVTLDAGHGGTTTGAVSGDYKEKVFNMDIIMRLNDILKAQGYDTYLTRKDDTYVSLADRADSANILKSNIFVSVHLNSYPSESVNGTETLYNSKAEASGSSLAELIEKYLVLDLKRGNRGIKDRPDLYVLNSTDMPAALAEVIFMSNQEELNLISVDDNRQKTAQAIAKAVNEYFGFQE